MGKLTEAEKNERVNDPDFYYLMDSIRKNASGMEEETPQLAEPYVIVSYSSNDWKTVIREVVSPLVRKKGLRVFFDGYFIGFEKAWTAQYLAVMADVNCRGILAFVDDDYATSYSTMLELMYSRLPEVSGGKKQSASLPDQLPCVMVKLSKLTGEDKLVEKIGQNRATETLTPSRETRDLFDYAYRTMPAEYRSTYNPDAPSGAPARKLTRQKCHQCFRKIMAKVSPSTDVFGVTDKLGSVFERIVNTIGADVFGPAEEAEKSPAAGEASAGEAGDGRERLTFIEFLDRFKDKEKADELKNYQFRLVGTGTSEGYTTAPESSPAKLIYGFLERFIGEVGDKAAVYKLNKKKKILLTEAAKKKAKKANPKTHFYALATEPVFYISLAGLSPYLRVKALWEDCIVPSGLPKSTFALELIPKTEAQKAADAKEEAEEQAEAEQAEAAAAPAKAPAAEKPASPAKTAPAAKPAPVKKPGAEKAAPPVKQAGALKAPAKTAPAKKPAAKPAAKKAPAAKDPAPAPGAVRFTLAEFLNRYTDKNDGKKPQFASKNCGPIRLIGLGEYASLSVTDLPGSGKDPGYMIGLLKRFVVGLIREKGGEVYLRIREAQVKNPHLLTEEEYAAWTGNKNHYASLGTEPVNYYLFKNVSAYGTLAKTSGAAKYLNILGLPLDKFILEFLPDESGKVLTDYDGVPASGGKAALDSGEPIEDAGI